MNLTYVEELGRFSLTVKRFLGICLAVPSLLFAIVFALEAIRIGRRPPSAWGNDPTTEIILVCVSLGFLAWGVWIHRQGRDGKRHPVYALLRDRAHEVVWVTRVIALGTGRDHVAFHLESGTCGGTLLVPTVQAPEILVQLARDLPHATFGTGGELQARYAQDPRQLRRTGAAS